MFFIISIIFISIVNNNINQVFGCQCPANDTRSYVAADGGEVLQDGKFKCYYVKNVGDARGTLFCTYTTDCRLDVDGDQTMCPAKAISTTTVSSQGGGGTTTTTTTKTTTTSNCKCPAADTTGAVLLGSQFVGGQLSCGYSETDDGCWYDGSTCALTLDKHGGLCPGDKTATTTVAGGAVTTTTLGAGGIVLTTTVISAGVVTTTTTGAAAVTTTTTGATAAVVTSTTAGAAVVTSTTAGAAVVTSTTAGAAAVVTSTTTGTAAVTTTIVGAVTTTSTTAEVVTTNVVTANSTTATINSTTTRSTGTTVNVQIQSNICIFISLIILSMKLFS